MPLQVVESMRLYRQIAGQIATLIDSGEFPVGSRLPPERELAVLLGVSRTSVREAILALEIEGRVEVRVGTGIFVSGTGTPATPDDGPGPFDLLAARELIEGEAVALAAARIDGDTLARLRGTIETMRRSDDDFATRDAADREFHALVAGASGNGAYPLLVEALWDQRRGRLWTLLEGHFHTAALRARTLDDHAAIVAALERRDATAARSAMVDHLQHVVGEFQRRWDEFDDGIRHPLPSRPSRRRGSASRRHLRPRRNPSPVVDRAVDRRHDHRRSLPDPFHLGAGESTRPIPGQPRQNCHDHTLPRRSRRPAAPRRASRLRSDAVRVGIIHLGIGAFHRAHQAVFTDDLLRADPRWDRSRDAQRGAAGRRERRGRVVMGRLAWLTADLSPAPRWNGSGSKQPGHDSDRPLCARLATLATRPQMATACASAPPGPPAWRQGGMPSSKLRSQRRWTTCCRFKADRRPTRRGGARGAGERRDKCTVVERARAQRGGRVEVAFEQGPGAAFIVPGAAGRREIAARAGDQRMELAVGGVGGREVTVAAAPW